MLFRENKSRESAPLGMVLVALWFLILALGGAAVWGMTKLKYNDGLERSFESSSQAYLDYSTFQTQFEGGANDLVALFEADDFATPAALEVVRDFALNVQFIDGVIGIVSPLSLQVETGSGNSESLVPAPALPQAEMAARFDSARAELPELDRFLSQDRQMMIVVVPMSQNPDSLEKRQTLLGNIKSLAEETVAGSDLQVTLTGYPVLRDGIVTALFSDFILLNTLGGIFGAVISMMALRSIPLAGLTAFSAGTALLWVLGLFGALGIDINVVTVALPVLVLVLGYSSALHLTMELRSQYILGQAGAVMRTLKRIAPACILTAITTAIAFSGLMLSPSGLIAGFGLAGVIAVLISLVAVLFAHPLLFVTLERITGLGPLFSRQRGIVPSFFHLSALPNAAGRAPRAITLGACALLSVAVLLYLTVEPSYSLYDNVAHEGDSFHALQRVEAELAPLSAINIPVRFDPSDPDTIENLNAIHAAISRHASGHDVLSLAPVAARALKSGTSLEELLEILPDTLRTRLVSKDGNWALVTILLRNEGSAALRDYLNTLTANFAADPVLRDAPLAAPTGLLAMSAFLSRDMLLDLNRCFILAVLVSGLLIMLWLRNPLIGLLALLPNVLPVALVGAWLALSGNGLEFSSGIALTIAFGLVIDDTIHVLNRLRLNMADGSPMQPELILRSVRQVSPALVVTSLVLSFGLVGTLFAALPSVGYFGKLSIFAFALALIADLLILPACLIVASRMLPARFLEIH